MSSESLDIRPGDEFVHYIIRAGLTADLFNEHVRALRRDACASCGRLWPCNMRRVAERAIALLGRPGPTG